MRADLHVHSTASDGTLSPSELVELASRNGVDVLAIADHDSVEGIAEARNAAARADITLIPAVEFSANDDGRDIHILAYHVDTGDPELLALLERARDAREVRAQAMVWCLQDAGLDLDLADVRAISGEAAMGRSHVAKALVARGHATTVADAFSRLIGRGRPCYIAKDAATSHEVVATIRRLGAVPVLAHPGITRVDDLLGDLVASGLLGIEAYHADHSAEQRARYAALAEELGLLATGGTDYHGPEALNPELGAVDVPNDQVSRLIALGPKAARG